MPPYPYIHLNTDLTYDSYDYNKGKIMDLIDVIVEGGAKVFVCAVGVYSQAVVNRLHAGGVLYMNMIGASKHAQRQSTSA
jgi:NAD(P)H-dependent flavin oxidoreductase YrpB (nitropropane dioxygenase family)